MTADQFRKLALQFPETVEAAHGGHPDFRVRNKVFASLAADESQAMVRLTPEQQQDYQQANSGIFAPCPGAWGRRGYTHIQLKEARQPAVKGALLLAWRNTAPRSLLAEGDDVP